MRFNILALCLVLVSFSFIACQKEAGEGGNSSITGKVKTQEYSNGWFVGEYYEPEARVYIMYGNSTIYNDDMRTHFDGSYKFDYLYPGNYTLYTYTDCDTCPSGKDIVTQTVDITEKGQIVELPDFVVQDL